MTKIFAISDFHGQLSDKIILKIKKENPEIILSSGDFCGNKRLGKLFFKYAYGKSEEEIPENIKKEMEKLQENSLFAGKKIIQKIKSLNIPTFAIRGNWDPAPLGHDIPQGKHTLEDLAFILLFEKLESKNFHFVDGSILEGPDFILVGGFSSTSPLKPIPKPKKKWIEEYGKKEANKLLKELLRGWKIRQKVYDTAFESAIKIKRQTGKKIIFLTHNCPYNTKLDKIKKGPQKGKHYGSYQERLLIKKYKPDIVICGHMHENFGTDKIGKSIIYNTGSAMDGKFKVLRV